MNFSMRSSPRDKKEKVGGEKAMPAARHLNEAWLREPNASCKQTLPFFSPPRKIGVVLERALFTPAVPKSQGGLCASWRKARLLETALAQQSEKYSADRRSGHEEDRGAGGAPQDCSSGPGGTARYSGHISLSILNNPLAKEVHFSYLM